MKLSEASGSVRITFKSAHQVFQGLVSSRGIRTPVEFKQFGVETEWICPLCICQIFLDTSDSILEIFALVSGGY
jgi:hypothetical protein